MKKWHGLLIGMAVVAVGIGALSFTQARKAGASVVLPKLAKTSDTPCVIRSQETDTPADKAAVTTVQLASATLYKDAADLAAIRQAGVLRHLGVPYAHFVTGSGDGLDVELIQKFAGSLGVRYEYVATDWANVIGDLIGHKVTTKDGKAVIGETVPVRGDLIANGLTVLGWRKQVIEFSEPTFPTQIWLIAKADSPLTPITASGDVKNDIAAVKAMLAGHTMLGKANTCLEPSLYGLAETQAKIIMFDGKLNEVAPAVMNGAAETSILDVPDSLVALEKWPGQIKVIGPVSDKQYMAVGFAKESPGLREAFNSFMNGCWQDGSYEKLVRKYYPTAFVYYPDFFQKGASK